MHAAPTPPDAIDGATVLRALCQALRLAELGGADCGLLSGAVSRLAKAVRTVGDRAGWPLVLHRASDVWFVGGTPVGVPDSQLGAASDLASRLCGLGASSIEISAPLATDDLRILGATLAGSLPMRAFPVHVRDRTRLLAGRGDDGLNGFGKGAVAYASAVALLAHLRGGRDVQRPDHGALLTPTVRELCRLPRRTIRQLVERRPTAANTDPVVVSVDSALWVLATLRDLELAPAAVESLVLGALLIGLGGEADERAAADGAGSADAFHGWLLLGQGERAAASIGTTVAAGPHAEGDDRPDPPFSSRLVRLARCVLFGIRDARTLDDPPSLELVLNEVRQACGETDDTDALDLLARALGVLPVGTRVELTSGWRGVVTGGSREADGSWAARLRLVVDPFGQTIVPQDADLATASGDDEDYGVVRRVLRGTETNLETTRSQVLAESLARRSARADASTANQWPEDARREVLAPHLAGGTGPIMPSQSGEAPAQVRWVSAEDDTAPRDPNEVLLSTVGDVGSAPPDRPGHSGAGWRDLLSPSEAVTATQAPEDASALLEAYINQQSASNLVPSGPPNSNATTADRLLDKLASIDESAWPLVEPTKSLVEMPEDDGNPTHPWNHGPAPLEGGSEPNPGSSVSTWSLEAQPDESFAEDSVLHVSDIGRVHDLLGHYREARRWFDGSESDAESSIVPGAPIVGSKDIEGTHAVSDYLRKATRDLDAGEVSVLLDEVLAAADAADSAKDASRAHQLRDLAGYVQEVAAEADLTRTRGREPDLIERSNEPSERPFSRVPSVRSLATHDTPPFERPATHPGILALRQDEGDEDDEPIELAVNDEQPTREFEDRTPERKPTTPVPVVPRETPVELRRPDTPRPPASAAVPPMHGVIRERVTGGRPVAKKAPRITERTSAQRLATQELQGVSGPTSTAGTPMAAIRRPKRKKRRK